MCQEFNSNFDSLLKEFNRLWDNQPKDKKQFELLIEKAKSKPLTYRQQHAIIARCLNVINNSYGNTKKGIDFKAS